MGGNQQGVGGAYMESEPAVEGAVEGLRHRDGGGSSRLHRGSGCSPSAVGPTGSSEQSSDVILLALEQTHWLLC